MVRSYLVTGESKGHGTLRGTFSSLLLPYSQGRVLKVASRTL